MGYLGLFIIEIVYYKILHTNRSKLQSRSRFFIDCSDQSHDLWVTQSSSLLMCKVIYKQVRFILNWIFFSNIAKFINKCTTRNNIQIKCSILQYMSRSSIMAMTNHMIIMICESHYPCTFALSHSAKVDSWISWISACILSHVTCTSFYLSC